MSDYPDDWPEIAKRVKDEAGWKCEECGEPYWKPGHVLTVHHEDGDPSNCRRENLKALCQKCHLKKQNAAWRQRMAERKQGAKQLRLAL